MLRTWAETHHRWFGPGSNPLPLSAEGIRAVAAVCKLRGFRSFANYLSANKLAHIRLGHPWTAQLDLIAKESARSVNRGIGPARQSAALDLVATHGLALGHGPVVPSGPCSPGLMVCLGAFWLTREIEISTARAAHWSFTDTQVSWLLPVSKADPMALGATRTWGCLCIGSSALCPLHLAKRHWAFLWSQFAVNGTLPHGLPLFPTLNGRPASKAAVVASIEYVASALAEPLTDAAGRRRFGGHSLRVTGARHLATLGLELYKLSVLARWASPIILRYVAEAPLATVTEDCRRLLQGSSVQSSLQHIKQQVDSGSRTRASVDGMVLQAVDQLPVAVPTVVREPVAFLLNLHSGCWHAVAVSGSDIPREHWCTACGWHFRAGRSLEVAEWRLEAVFPADATTEDTCKDCFPHIIAASSRPSEQTAVKQESSDSD